MTREEVLEKMQAYCDGELPAREREAVERCLAQDEELGAFFAENKSFLAFCKSKFTYPAATGLEARLAQHLQAIEVPDRTRSKSESSVGTVTRPVLRETRKRSAWRVAAAAAVLVLATTIYGFWDTIHGECLYIVACTQEYRKVVDGIYALVPFEGPETLAKHCDCLKETPDLEGFGLRLAKIGRTRSFHNLKGAPDAICFLYANSEQPERQLVVIVHPWPEEVPAKRNFRKEFDGWTAKYDKSCVYSWKTACGTLLCSVVAPDAFAIRQEMLQLALSTRKAIDKASNFNPQ